MAATQTVKVQVRGPVFTTFGEWFTDKKGKDAYLEFKNRLPEEVSATLAGANRVKRYPLTHLLTLFEVAEEHFKVKELNEYGAYLCAFSLSTRFRDLAAYLDPETFIRRMPLFWSRYFDGGNLEAEELAPGSAFLKLRNPIGNQSITLMFAGWFRQALFMMRATDVSVEGKDYSWKLAWKWSN
jgi:hypothetical protein